MAKKIGRPSKLVPERVDKLLEAIRAGNYIHTAVLYAGISDGQFYHWLEIAETHRELKQKSKYTDFAEAVKKAEADAEARQVALISKAAIDTWQAAAWMLERKHPAKWGNRIRAEITGEGGAPIKVEALVVNIDAREVARTVLEAMRLGLSPAMVEGNGHSEDAALLSSPADIQATPISQSKN